MHGDGCVLSLLLLLSSWCLFQRSERRFWWGERWWCQLFAVSLGPARSRQQDMDIYLTHEPCLSCCMGLLLSRCRAIIFPRNGRMITGGVASEPVLSSHQQQQEEDEDENEGAGGGKQRDKSRDPRNNRKYYGLHWRKELNWRALGFEFVEDGYSFEEMGIEGEDGIAFHA